MISYLVDAIAIYGLALGMTEAMQGGLLTFWGNWIATLPEWLYKPLGGCLICFGTWLTLIYYNLELDILTLLGLFYFVVYVVAPKIEKIR